AGNITNNGLTFDDLVYVPAGKISVKQRIRKNDIVIAASSGSLDVVGKAARALNDFDGGFGAFCKVLRPRKEVNAAYFSHYFKTPEYRKLISSLAAGANINNLRNGDLDDLEIPLPPLAEQKRIAGILDAADALRAKRRESLAQLDSLLQSTFLDLFGDPVTNPIYPAKCIEEIVGRIIDYRGKSPEKTTEGIPLITAKIVKKKGVDEPNEFIAKKAYDAWMRRGIPLPQDVIITTEAPMGEVALVPAYKAAFAQRLLVLQPKRDILEPIYLMWALTMPFVTRQMDQRATGSTVTGIRSKEFRKVAVSLPPLPLQHKFAAIVESIERQKAAQRGHLAELDALFAALQHRAFRGEL
ncbi:MAG: restriction endonuclease subunit S, partial [Verrucomicrobiaceae bacterium]